MKQRSDVMQTLCCSKADPQTNTQTGGDYNTLHSLACSVMK